MGSKSWWLRRVCQELFQRLVVEIVKGEKIVSPFQAGQHIDPVILFSHIPLYRSDGKPCGALREHGTLRPGVGLGYQNVLEKQSSQRLLEAFKPVVIFRYVLWGKGAILNSYFMFLQRR